MKYPNNNSLKLNLRFEFSLEVILNSLIFIFFGLTFLLVSNLRAFHWGIALCIVIAVFLVSLKNGRFIEIEDKKVTIQYFKKLHTVTIDITQIRQVVFYEDSLRVELHLESKEEISFYLKQRNREKLLSFIVTNYPSIPCLFYDKTDETAR